MSVPPLPIDEQGRSQVAACSTGEELVELLAGLWLETDAGKVTLADHADFRMRCREALPLVDAQRIDAVPLLEIFEEVQRQLDEGLERDRRYALDWGPWLQRAVAGCDELDDQEPELMREGRAGALRSVFRRVWRSQEIRVRVDEEFDRLMREPPHPIASRGRLRRIA